MTSYPTRSTRAACATTAWRRCCPTCTTRASSMPSPEPTHALAAAIEEARRCAETGEPKVILTALCGHGHFDMAAYDRYLSGRMEDLDLSQDRIDEALTRLP